MSNLLDRIVDGPVQLIAGVLHRINETPFGTPLLLTGLVVWDLRSGYVRKWLIDRETTPAAYWFIVTMEVIVLAYLWCQAIAGYFFPPLQVN